MAVGTIGLKTHIWNNNIRSIFLLIGFPCLLLAMVWMIGAGIHLSFGGTASQSVQSGHDAVMSFGHWALLIAGIWLIIAWFFHVQMINAAAGARPLQRDEEPRLYNLLENICISRGLSMPKLQIIESPGLNAFASGINNKTYSITLTRGLLETLRDDEIEAVLAHELTHIVNRDVRLLIISVVFVGMIGFLAQALFRGMVYGGYRVRGNGGNRRNDPRIMVIALLVLAVGYIFALLIRFALSRGREYMADAGAIELTKNPKAMMRALKRISGNDYVEETPADIEQMCIENSHRFMGIFATHPSISERIKIISQLTDTPIPE